MSGHGRAGCTSRGRGRGKNLASARVAAPNTTVTGTSPAAPQTAVPVVPPTAESAACRDVVPAVRIRRSAGKPQHSHVISFPQITDTEGIEDEDEDGLDNDFSWQRDGF